MGETSAISGPAIRTSRWVLLTGLATGLGSFGYYYFQGLTTAHYDAKAHLVVARRLVDSLSPGYEQMGAHWLPLLHLLYLPAVLFDGQYLSGLIPSLISVFAFSLSGWLVFRISKRLTGSDMAGVFAAGVLLANPNLQYLQSSPMTEPVYMLLFLLALDSLIAWREVGGGRLPWAAALWIGLGAVCRYEGWYLAAGIGVLLVWDCSSGRLPLPRALRAATVLAGGFALPVAAHFGYIYYRLGDTFLHKVAKGAEVPAETYKRPFLAALYHAGELFQATALLPLLAAVAGLLLVLAARRDLDRRLPLMLLWIPSLINISALYWGLIYRVRYSILLVPAVAIFSSFLVGSGRSLRRVFLGAAILAMLLPWLPWLFPHKWKYNFLFAGPGILILPALALVLAFWALSRKRYAVPLLLLLVAGMQFPALRGESRAMLREALEHEFIEPQRSEVLSHLAEHYDGTRILIDMGRQAPLIYDSQLPVREFIYNEGGGGHWHRAIWAPHAEAGWICAEEGDEVWKLLHVDPPWLERYLLALQTRNFVLYRLQSDERELLLKRNE